jgi:hypothetical protein
MAIREPRLDFYTLSQVVATPLLNWYPEAQSPAQQRPTLCPYTTDGTLVESSYQSRSFREGLRTIVSIVRSYCNSPAR